MWFFPSVLHEISSWIGQCHCFRVENANVNTGFVTDRRLGTEHKCMGLGHCQTCIWGGRSNEGLYVMIFPTPNSACDQLLGHPWELYPLGLSSALLWCHLQKTQTCFQPWPKLFCCFMVRAGHHDNTLNLTLKWNKSSGNCPVWKCKEITGSRPEHMMPTAGARASTWSLNTATGKDPTSFWDNAQHAKGSSPLLPGSPGPLLCWPSISDGGEVKGCWHGSRAGRSSWALPLLCDALLQWFTGQRGNWPYQAIRSQRTAQVRLWFLAFWGWICKWMGECVFHPSYLPALEFCFWMFLYDQCSLSLINVMAGHRASHS